MKKLFFQSETEVFVPARRSSNTQYNLKKIPRFAMELVRAEISSTSAAALGNALLLDLKDLLKPEIAIEDIMLDKCKIDRAKSKVKNVSTDTKLWVNQILHAFVLMVKWTKILVLTEK